MTLHTLSCFVLVLWMCASGADVQLCLLSRLDRLPCPLQPNLPTAGINQYAIYRTTIQPGSSGFLECRLRGRRNVIVRDISTLGTNEIRLLYSPGFQLDPPEAYANDLLVIYNVHCNDDERIFFNITRQDIQPRNCGDPPVCADYIQVLRSGGYGVTESCGNDTGNNAGQLEGREMTVQFRTSDMDRFPGFEMFVICYKPGELNLPGCTRVEGNIATGIVPAPGEEQVAMELMQSQLSQLTPADDVMIDGENLGSSGDLGISGDSGGLGQPTDSDGTFDAAAVRTAIMNENACNPVLRAFARSVLTVYTRIDELRVNQFREELRMVTPTSPPTQEVCPREVDREYGIAWGYAAPGETSLQSCGTDYIGTATRLCQSDATWAPPDVSLCENVAFATLRTTAERLYSNVTVVDDETLAMTLDVVNDLVVFTEPTNISIFPRDLNTSNFIITNTVDLLYMNLDQGGTTDITASTEVVGVIDNLLNPVNLAGFEDLQAEAPASQSVLNNAERYALYLATAMSQNTSEQSILLSRGNIVIRSERISVNRGTQLSDVVFPLEGEIENFTISSRISPPVIRIPAQLIVERSNSSTISVANIQFQNLQDFLPPELNNSTAAPASLIISSQVAGVSMGSQTLQENPVTITFGVEGETDERFSCVFWKFSDPIGNGGWSTEGVTVVQVTQDGNNTVVQCNSTHLTSFAVLVNVAGAPVDSLALSIVSYVGLGISLACLLLTIIFFLSLGKKLFTGVHNFVHLNLAIALFVAYLTFAIGVELARTNKAACQVVTAIMQYFFLASFCWMLCEGIMLYLMLVLVFSRLSKKWWFFFLLGWTPPIIFVVIGLTTVLDEYVVYSRNATGGILTDAAGNIISFCWLSSGFGSNAIWTFVAPMLAIVLINSVFLILVLVSVLRSRRHRMSEMKEKGKRVDLVVTMVKASLILLPLLGLTWVLGLFAVNQNTLVFAWLFTIFNSLQGLFIFTFHVLKSERVWGRIKKKYSIYSSTHSRAGDKGTSGTSGGKKTSGVTDSSGGESTLEMKEKMGASLAYTTHFEPNDDTIKKPISDDDVAAVVISETTINAERPVEEEVKNKSDLTSDEPTSDAVETTAAEAVLTGYKESMEEEVGFSGEKEYVLVEVDKEEQLTVQEGGGHIGEVGVNQQTHLLKMRKDDTGAMVRRKEFHTELLLRRNEELRKRMESVLGVSLSEDTTEQIRDDILLCRLMNKLHPGMIHEETSAEKRVHNVADFITACKKLRVPEHKLCTAGDIMEGKNMDSMITCLEYLLESSSL